MNSRKSVKIKCKYILNVVIDYVISGWNILRRWVGSISDNSALLVDFVVV